MNELCHQETANTETLKQDALKRLKRAEGQVRGVIRMLEEDKYCIDVINQISAARSALNNAGNVILERHMRTCVTRAVQSGGDEQENIIGELMTLFKRKEL